MEPELWDALEVGGGREDRATPCDSAVWSDAAEGAPRSMPGMAGLDEVYVPSLREPQGSGPVARTLGGITHPAADSHKSHNSHTWRPATATVAHAT